VSVRGASSGRHGYGPQLIPHWNFWPQTRHSSWPTPAFLSSLTVTDFSWLQNRQVKVVGKGSFYRGKFSDVWKERAGLRVAHLLGPLRLARTLLAFAHDDVFLPTRNTDRRSDYSIKLFLRRERKRL